MRWCSLLSFFLLASLVVSQDGRGRSQQTPTDDGGGDCGEVCESEVDVVFLLDDSNSIAEFQFDIMKEFVADVISNDVKLGEGQVGIIQFDDDSSVRCSLEDSQSAVERCLANTIYTAGGLTNIEAAIVDAINIRNQRRNLPRIMVLMTDGDPTAGGDPVIAAERAKEDGWEIFAIGIGNVSEDMLKRIATDDDHVIIVEEFEDLEGLDFSVCVEGDCPEPDPCAEECESIVDVVFVIDDSNSIADWEFDLMKEFIGLVIDDLGVGDNGANIGIVQFDDSAETICDIEDTDSAVRSCLEDTVFDEGGLTNIAQALQEAKEIRGGRSGVTKVLVLMTDGTPTIGGDPQPVADMAKDEGWTIYAIGIGNADLGFLEDLASDPGLVFLAENFEDLLMNVVDDFKICVGGTGSGGETCNSEVDLIFILDESNSIADWEFELVKDFAIMVANTIQISPSQGQVAVVKFDDSAQIEFNLDDNSDAAGVESDIRSIRFVEGGKTNIDDGFVKALEVDGRRSGVPGVIVLATDGDPTAGDSRVPTAQDAKDAGFEVWVVAIGDVNERLVEDMATSPDHIIEVDDVGGLEAVVNEIQVCESVPCDVPCDDVCEAKVDVCFILDESNSLADFQFDQMKEFVTAIVTDLGVGANAAYVGIVQFDDTAEVVCDFQSSMSGAMGCIADATHTDGGLTNIGDAINACAGLRGGRNDVTDVMVLMTDGEPTIGEDPADVADDVKRDGWEIYAIGIGEVSEGTLNSIASSPDNVFMADDFDMLLEEVLAEFSICVPADDCGVEEEVAPLCGKADIVWITDHSSSIAQWQLDLLFEFQITIVESTSVGPDFAMFGQVGFSDDGFTNFHLDECSDSACVVNEIRSIRLNPGNTNLASGIREGRDIRGTRRGVDKVFFLATDGVPNREEDQIEPEYEAAMDEGWSFICLAIGDADFSFLEDFCDEILEAENFETLQEEASKIVCN